MADDTQASTRFSLRRWSQRKLAAGRSSDPARADDAKRGQVTPNAPVAAPLPASPAAAIAETRQPAAHPVAGEMQPQTGGQALPSLESLTIDSDFSPFMQAGVDEGVRRSALRKLLRHPQFNVMDGLDVYIDDYSIPSPLEPELVRTLMQARYIFNPPKTSVNADGHVEDVPDEPASAHAGTLDVDANASVQGVSVAEISSDANIDDPDRLNASDSNSRDSNLVAGPLNPAAKTKPDPTR